MHFFDRSYRSRLVALVLASGATGLTSCATDAVADIPSDSAVVAIGKQIFLDSSLSASGRISCSSCHDPNHAYGPRNNLAVQLGGPHVDRQGARAAPSLRYVLNKTPKFYKEYASNLADRIREGNEPPVGGFGLDGRFASLHEQAAFPLFAENEMANTSKASVVDAMAHSAYAKDMRRAFGAEVFEDSVRALSKALMAVERFELMDKSFHPYDSKYDAYLDGKTELSAAERRGLTLFDEERRGNCSSCHLDQKGADGTHPLFTDYQFGALGVPRNTEIVANSNPKYFDMGLCGPTRVDQHEHAEYCGMFKTPTLRNVATRGAFFHNGVIHSLKDALRFYVNRDASPERWYSSHGKFDDLPQTLRGNVDTITTPLDRHRGARPVWSDAEIDDVIAFLNTLTDGYQPVTRASNKTYR